MNMNVNYNIYFNRKQMANFFRRLMGFKKQKDISELTDFLANNDAFKQAAQKIHQNTQQVKGGFGIFGKLDKYLEDELLPKEYHQNKGKVEPPKQLPQQKQQTVYNQKPPTLK